MSQSGPTPSRTVMQGMVRDRTQQFLKYRGAHRSKTQAFADPDDPNKKLLGGEISSAASLSMAVAPEWVEVSSEVQQGITDIKGKMAKLQQVHSKVMLTTFEETDMNEQEVEVMTQEITRIFKKCEGRLVGLAKMPGSEADVKVRQNVQRQLASELQTLSMEFRKQQKNYLQKVRAREEGSSLGGGALDMIDQALARNDDYDPGFTDAQMERVRQAEALAEEREKEIINVLKSINDLAQIMKDLSTLVIDQGTIVDRIDYNMEQVSQSIEKGVQELKKAQDHQKASTNVLIIMILIAAIILMAVIVLVKFAF